jgi:ACS family tartrate transporter-like MFS transporter
MTASTNVRQQWIRDREADPMPGSSETLMEIEPNDLERTVFRKVTLRLMPFLCLVYFFNILDRANIDFARLQMLDDAGISKFAYGLGAGIFSIGYCVLEVPSNLILSRVGARRWIARIMISWGLISAAMLFIVGPWSFCVLRFLLGCAEAGFFPGILLYLTYWFPARQRARAVALFMVASPLTWVVGGPLSGALLEFTHQWGGLAGWQWLFLLEGLSTVILGGITLYYLTDRPAQANWLTPAERSCLTERLAADDQERERQHGWTLRQAVADRRVWHLIALASTIAFGISGLAYFFTPLVKDRFNGLDSFEIGLLKALAGACTLLAMVAVGLHSDRKRERRWHVAGAAFLAAAGWALSMQRDIPVASFLGMVLAQAAMMSMWGPFWSLATTRLGSRAAAGGIALINAIANLGAFFGPTLMGWSESVGDFTLGLAVMGLALVLGGVLALCVGIEVTPAPSRSPGAAPPPSGADPVPDRRS